MIKKIMTVLITGMFFGLLALPISYGDENTVTNENITEATFGSSIYETGKKIGADGDDSFDNPSIEPLPRWREGGTPYNEKQLLHPCTLNLSTSRDSPLSGFIESPTEYSPTHGVLFWYSSGVWDTVVRDLVVALTQDDGYDEIAYVVVTSTTQQNSATNLFTAGGANMSKVKFTIQPGETIWIRDYGPHFITQDSALGIVDSHYYPSRPLDNFNPTLLGDGYFIMPTYDMGLYYSGGNFQPGPNRTGYITSLTLNDNPGSEGFNTSFIQELYHTYQGIDTLHVMPQLPPSVDGTGHIDMWFYLVDNDTVIISEFQPGSNPTAIQITNDAADFMEQNLSFTVYRTPAWNAPHPGTGYSTHWTYTNCFRVNNRIFISTFGETYTPYADEDATALATFQAAVGPDVEIVQIDSYPIIWAAGAVHCIVVQVPRYVDPLPTIHVMHPNGGELLVPGTTETISWVASDTDNVNIAQIDLYYSIDGGETYEFIATTADTGFYDWAVPAVTANHVLIKAVAHSQDTDTAEDVSDAVFTIAPAQQTVYDFSLGAGTDKFGWGYQTSAWYLIDETRLPVTTDIESLVSGAYTKIASSDNNRYISPTPSTGSESTHVFEFTIAEDPSIIDDIGILWEGYAGSCTQVELYIWDYVAGQWSDGQGQLGQNHYLDSWAGNIDGYLDYHIGSNFTHYINQTGHMTLLVYADRYGDPTFHDYLSVTVSEITGDPQISNVEATPLTQNIGDWVNISCDVIAPEGIDTVNAVIIYPDNTTINQTMTSISGTIDYYYNVSYSQAGNYSFYIFARDDEGNTDVSLVYWFMVANFFQSFNFTLGWNLVTIPLAHDWTAEDLGNNITDCTVVIMYNTSTDTFVTHVVNTPHDNFPILDGVGYFIYVTSDSNLTVSGYPLADVSVPIDTEWNLIGWYHDYPTTAESLGENITNCTVVIMFDGISKNFITHVVHTPHDNFTIERGRGLFIYTTEASIWQGEG